MAGGGSPAGGSRFGTGTPTGADGGAFSGGVESVCSGVVGAGSWEPEAGAGAVGPGGGVGSAASVGGGGPRGELPGWGGGGAAGGGGGPAGGGGGGGGGGGER